LRHSEFQKNDVYKLKTIKRDYPLFTSQTIFSIILKKTMENKNEVFVLNLPNIGNEDLIKLTEQLILQSDKLMEGYRVENKNLILDIIFKKD